MIIFRFYRPDFQLGTRIRSLKHVKKTLGYVTLMHKFLRQPTTVIKAVELGPKHILDGWSQKTFHGGVRA